MCQFQSSSRWAKRLVSRLTLFLVGPTLVLLAALLVGAPAQGHAQDKALPPGVSTGDAKYPGLSSAYRLCEMESFYADCTRIAQDFLKVAPGMPQQMHDAGVARVAKLCADTVRNPTHEFADARQRRQPCSKIDSVRAEANVPLTPSQVSGWWATATSKTVYIDSARTLSHFIDECVNGGQTMKDMVSSCECYGSGMRDRFYKYALRDAAAIRWGSQIQVASASETYAACRK